MPRLAYILCSQSGSEDAQTDLVSAFNLIETLPFARAEGQLVAPIPLPIRVVVCWMRMPSDPPDGEYELELACEHVPTGTVLWNAEEHYQFDSTFYRFIVGGHLESVPGPGMLLVRAKTRLKGTSEWLA